NEEVFAGGLLGGEWVAVAGGAALERVADVNFLALEAEGADHFVQKLAGAANEGEALRVLVAAGGFADEGDFRLGIAVAENQLVALAAKRAGSAGFGLGGKFGKFFDPLGAGEV